MKRFLILFPITMLALASGELVDLGVITVRDGIEIHKCHEGDKALIEVVHVGSKTNSAHGWFETEKRTLGLSDLSMIPTGTNLFRVRTLCSGSTSEVSEVKFVIRRPIPRPVLEKVDRFAVVTPPMPPGFVGALPSGTNADYSQVRWFKDAEQRRRSE